MFTRSRPRGRGDRCAATGQVEQYRAGVVQQFGDPAAVVEDEIRHHQPGQSMVVADVIADVGPGEQPGKMRGDIGFACQLAEKVS